MTLFTSLVGVLSVLAASTTPPTLTIKAKDINHGGSGCPPDVTVIKETDYSIRLLPDMFKVSASKPTEAIARYSCNFSIPVNGTKGYRIGLPKIQVRGTVNLPDTSTARLNIETFFAGEEGPKTIKDYKGALQKRLKFNAVPTPMKWSECGGSVNLRANFGVMVRNSGDKQATVEISSIRIPKQIVLKPCN